MAGHNIRPDLSANTEMYLVAINRLEAQASPVPIKLLAQTLTVSPVSANEMCRRLEDQGLLEYIPYHGARLLKAGREIANRVERRHCLWEVFLVDRLGFGRGIADAMACELEHATSEELEDKLDAFLGYPARSPGGTPIPPRPDLRHSLPLSALAVGSRGMVESIEGEQGIASYMKEAGIIPGVEIQICARCGYGTLVSLESTSITLSSELESSVRVSVA